MAGGSWSLRVATAAGSERCGRLHASGEFFETRFFAHEPVKLPV